MTSGSNTPHEIGVDINTAFESINNSLICQIDTYTTLISKELFTADHPIKTVLSSSLYHSEECRFFPNHKIWYQKWGDSKSDDLLRALVILAEDYVAFQDSRTDERKFKKKEPARAGLILSENGLLCTKNSGELPDECSHSSESTSEL